MDYRESHQKSGSTYDDFLEKESLSAYMTKCEKKLLTRAIKKVFPNPLYSYLDFACGTGRITSVVAPIAEKSFGVDISASMLEEAQKKCPNTEFFHSDITTQHLDIEPVELITAFRFFGNAQDSLRIDALAAIWQLLKPGGYLIINNHRNPWSIMDILYRLRGGVAELTLSPRKISFLLKNGGFEVVRVYGIGSWIFRHGLARASVLKSPLIPYLELLSKLPGFYLISPDAIIIARKKY